MFYIRNKVKEILFKLIPTYQFFYLIYAFFFYLFFCMHNYIMFNIAFEQKRIPMFIKFFK